MALRDARYRKWLRLGLPLGALIGGVALAIAGVLSAIAGYRFAAELRLAPIHTDRYAQDNAQLGSTPGRRIVFFGDSRIEYWSPRPVITDAELLWRGIAGETTAQLLGRFDSDVVALQPTAIVVQGGINDLVAGEALDRGAEAARLVVANLRALQESASRSGIRVLLLGIVPPARIPLWRRPLLGSDVYRLVDETNRALAAGALPGTRYVSLDEALGPAGSPLPARYAADTLHFTPEGYRRINALLTPLLDALPHALQ